jgi:hypothetical protein
MHEPSYLFHIVRVRQPIRSHAPASYAITAGVGLVEVGRPDLERLHGIVRRSLSGEPS